MVCFEHLRSEYIQNIWNSPPFDQAFQDWFDQWWRPYSVKVRVNTTPTAERYFSDKNDWMIVPAAVAKDMEKRGFVSCPLLEPAPHHYVYLVYHKRNQAENVALFRQAAHIVADMLC